MMDRVNYGQGVLRGSAVGNGVQGCNQVVRLLSTKEQIERLRMRAGDLQAAVAIRLAEADRLEAEDALLQAEYGPETAQ